MSKTLRFGRLALLLAVISGPLGLASAAAHAPSQKTAPSQHHVSATQPTPDLSGRKRVGKASFYAKNFAGKKMADGAGMDPHHGNAASKTLPLGTTAKVTNLETGQSAKVTMQDRGPHVKGRIVDLSPSTAQKIGITPKTGVATVKVDPITVPQPDGSLKSGVVAPDEMAK